MELIIFDLDGTLVDSRTDIALSANHMRRELGLEPLPVELINTFVGDGALALVERALGEENRDLIERGLRIFVEHYRDHLLDHTCAFPGVKETLVALSDKTLALLTNKPEDMSRKILYGLSLGQHFAYIFGGDSFPRRKPDPIGVNFLLERTGARPERALMVGDLENDILTGKNAGVLTCGVSYGLAGERLRALEPDFFIDDIRQLREIVD